MKFWASNLTWFVVNSLKLDLKLTMISTWTWEKKIEFIIKKYYLLIIYLTGVRTLSVGQSYIKLFRKKFYFAGRFGLAGYQRIATSHRNMIQLANISNVSSVIDIGAYEGAFTTLIRELYPAAKVYAVEPVPQTYKALEQNFKEDDKIFLINRAISNINGTSCFKIDGVDVALSHLKSSNDEIAEHDCYQNVPVQTLDSLVTEANINKIDILKIDVEKFEKHVLEGGRRTLEKTKFLLLEVSIEDNTNYTFSELMSLLYKKGKYNFQLRSFRNFSDKGEGKMKTADFLFENNLL